MNAAAPAVPRPVGRDVARALPWLALAALWMISTNYRGLYHDAVLYSFQAIAHLRPELYSADIFLRFGSQDRFTLFPSVYSLLVGWLGVESAAAWTTFAATLGLALTALHLVRRLAPEMALLGLAFLIALPGSYGPYGIFNVFEPYVTPRMPAEALALGAVLAILAGRRLLAAALLIVGASIHPLMAAPAVVIVAFFALPAERRWYLPAAAGAGLLALAIGGSLSVIDAFRIDATWNQFFDAYARYLFATGWRFVDWMHMCPAMLTLLVGSRVLTDSTARELCVAVLFTAALGMAIMLIGADWLRIALVVQGQGYRWLWPATLVALLLLPAVGAQLWRLGSLGRAALFALAALWISRDEPFVLTVTLVAALICIVAIRDTLPLNYRRWVLTGAAVMFGIAACVSLAGRWLSVASAYEQSSAPAMFDQVRWMFADGLIPAVLLIVVYTLAREPARRFTNAAAALALLSACAVLAPVNFASWTRRDFDARMHEAFASWRALIPPRSEVVWIEAPEAAWLLLERPSYFSIRQSITGVFSRAAALEIMARERLLVPLMKGDGLASTLMFVDEKRSATRDPARTLTEACDGIGGKFIVARAVFQARSLAEAPSDAAPGYRKLHLYHCDPIP